MDMKQIQVALMCLLLLGEILQGTEGNTMHVSSSSCCYTFQRKRIPPVKIECYRNTGSSCSYSNGVIFRLKGGKESCVSKTRKWVMSYLSQVKSCL